MLDGLVLDGRNRMRACVAAGVPFRVEEFEGGDPVAFVVSANLRRRHLDESQRSVVATKLANLNQGRPSDKAANLPLCGERVTPITQAEAAEMLNVSERSVRAARVVLEDGVPALVEKVERGEVSVSAAADVARLPVAEQEEIVAQGEAEILRAANAVRRKRKEKAKEERQAQIVEASAAIPDITERYWLYQQPHKRGLDLMPGKLVRIAIDR